MATFFLLSFWATNSAAATPWASSVKHTRKTYSRPSVTFTLVDEGVIIGTLLVLAMRPPASERDEATSPSSATTLFRSMSCRTFCVASLAFDLSSS